MVVQSMSRKCVRSHRRCVYIYNPGQKERSQENIEENISKRFILTRTKGSTCWYGLYFPANSSLWVATLAWWKCQLIGIWLTRNSRISSNLISQKTEGNEEWWQRQDWCISSSSTAIFILPVWLIECDPLAGGEFI